MARKMVATGVHAVGSLGQNEEAKVVVSSYPLVRRFGSIVFSFDITYTANTLWTTVDLVRAP